MRHTAAVLTKHELTRQLLALVLTAVLVWHTALIPPTLHAPSKRPRRRSRGGEERGAKSLLGGVVKNTSKSEVEWVDDLDWPDYIGLD